MSEANSQEVLKKKRGRGKQSKTIASYQFIIDHIINEYLNPSKKELYPFIYFCKSYKTSVNNYYKIVKISKKILSINHFYWLNLFNI